MIPEAASAWKSGLKEGRSCGLGTAVQVDHGRPGSEPAGRTKQPAVDPQPVVGDHRLPRRGDERAGAIRRPGHDQWDENQRARNRSSHRRGRSRSGGHRHRQAPDPARLTEALARGQHEAPVGAEADPFDQFGTPLHLGTATRPQVQQLDLGPAPDVPHQRDAGAVGGDGERVELASGMYADHARGAPGVEFDEGEPVTAQIAAGEHPPVRQECRQVGRAVAGDRRPAASASGSERDAAGAGQIDTPDRAPPPRADPYQGVPDVVADIEDGKRRPVAERAPYAGGDVEQGRGGLVGTGCAGGQRQQGAAGPHPRPETRGAGPHPPRPGGRRCHSGAPATPGYAWLPRRAPRARRSTARRATRPRPRRDRGRWAAHAPRRIRHDQPAPPWPPTPAAARCDR